MANSSAFSLLSRQTVARKLQMLFMLCLLPIGLLLWLFITQCHTEINFAKKELGGADYLKTIWPIFDTASDVQDGIQNTLNADFPQRLAAAGERNAALFSVSELEKQMISQYQAAIQHPADNAGGKQAANTAQDLMGKVVDASNLSLDPGLDSYNVIDIITLKAPALNSEASSIVRIAKKYLASGSLTAAEKAEYVISCGRFKAALEGVGSDYTAAVNGNQDSTVKAHLSDSIDKLTESSNAFYTLAMRLSLTFTGDTTEQLNTASLEKARDTFSDDLNGLWAKSADEISNLIQVRIQGLEKTLWMNLGFVAALCAVIVMLTLTMVRSVSASLLELNRAFGALAQLDLTLRGKVMSKDDIGLTLERYNHTADVLTEVISSTQQSAITVSAATNELSSTMANISGISGRQEAAMDEIVGAVHEANASAQNAAEKTKSSSELNLTAFSRIHSIKNVLEKLHQNSQDIQEARDLIDSISDKINLLSLNATIEAARAGDAGRGFAVVAEEVKKLALRTSASTESIGKTVDSLKNNVTDSSKELDAILGMLEEVRGNSEEVVNAVHSQEAAVQQISVKVDEFRQQLTQVTSNVNESRIASESIAESAELLSQQSRRFKLTASKAS